jgi:hypothetical protein
VHQVIGHVDAQFGSALQVHGDRVLAQMVLGE